MLFSPSYRAFNSQQKKDIQHFYTEPILCSKSKIIWSMVGRKVDGKKTRCQSWKLNNNLVPSVKVPSTNGASVAFVMCDGLKPTIHWQQTDNTNNTLAYPAATTFQNCRRALTHTIRRCSQDGASLRYIESPTSQDTKKLEATKRESMIHVNLDCEEWPSPLSAFTNILATYSV